MNLNLGSADRKLRAFVVAPVFVVAGVLVGPASVPAIVLYALAGVMAGDRSGRGLPAVHAVRAAHLPDEEGHRRGQGANRRALASPS